MSADFLVGFTAMGCLVAAVLFVGLWQTTSDRLFAFFAVAFATFGVNRIALGFVGEHSEGRPVLYVVRLLAFLVIVAAIADKNRVRR